VNFKETLSQEEHKIIFSDLKMNEQALSEQVDFPAFFRLLEMTYQNFINSGTQQSSAACAL
jgi:hypothetical protein